MRYIALICARGGSKGLPKKNIKPLEGIPLIGWSINIAKKIDKISRVIVSTDCDEIAQVAINYGAEVPFIRPNNLSNDDSSEWKVWQHALKYLYDNIEEPFDGLVILPPTAPLRSIEDVENCIIEFEKGNVDIVISTNDANRNPYFNMVKKDEENYCSLVCEGDHFFRRQDAPLVFDITTVAYVVTPKFIQKYNGIFEGRVRSVNIPSERAIDIDTLLDFQIAELLISQNNAD
jgi:CMP-N-acetylneuraminic acid synthetase